MTDLADPADAGRPDPATVATAGEFVELMRQLKRWSGLGYRQLAQRAALAGYTLPRSTLTVALNRGTLPREDLVAAFVRTCGCDDETVTRWVNARRRIAAAAADGPGPAARWLGARRVPVTGRVGRPEAGEEPDQPEDAGALELVNTELAERCRRQAASGSSIETRAVLVIGIAAVAAPLLASRPAQQPVLQRLALVGYLLAFLGAALAIAVGSPGDAPAAATLVDDYAQRPRTQLLNWLATARAALLRQNATRLRQKSTCWWIAIGALGAATVLSVLAVG